MLDYSVRFSTCVSHDRSNTEQFQDESICCGLTSVSADDENTKYLEAV